MVEQIDRKKTSNEKKEIRVIWDSDDGLPILYANNLYISHGGDTEFHLTFGQLIPPIIFGLSEEELPQKVKVTPIARIVIAPDVMERFVNVMNENLEKYKKKKEGNK